ncbi:hypothetical protein ACFSE1_01950 [Rhizobium helianthi]|uniref:Uncharacterized protein n=1 Tax=Rhizobium helianthi TaxID=1132695 RepID=A0ABW4LYE8_9HYPH
MALKKLLVPILLLVPAAASAADNAARCLALGKEIASTPTVIGSTGVVNAHAQALADVTAEMRRLRSEMQRMRCGTGSIVTFGVNDPCNALEQRLIDADRDRQAILASRTQQGKLVGSLGRDQEALREEMRRLRCGEIDYSNVPASITPLEPGEVKSPKEPSKALPPTGNSILKLGEARGTTYTDTSPKPPVRDWEPDKPVRTVGPQFFPDGEDSDVSRPGVQPSR